MTPSLPDLTDRAGIKPLVNRFYEIVRKDANIGFIFEEIVQVNWELNLPNMYPFWETVLFRSGGDRGDPIAAHSKFVSKTEIGKAQFEHWLKLFRESVDSLFFGENARPIKRCAKDMANVIHGKMNGVQDPRFDPANLTPEHRIRYAKYKNQKEPEA